MATKVLSHAEILKRVSNGASLVVDETEDNSNIDELVAELRRFNDLREKESLLFVESFSKLSSENQEYNESLLRSIQQMMVAILENSPKKEAEKRYVFEENFDGSPKAVRVELVSEDDEESDLEKYSKGLNS